jgi:hypothetical protein
MQTIASGGETRKGSAIEGDFGIAIGSRLFYQQITDTVIDTDFASLREAF